MRTEVIPLPGRRTVPQQTAQSSANPTAGESHDQCRAPQSAMAACPIASEEPHTASAAAYVPITSGEPSSRKRGEGARELLDKHTGMPISSLISHIACSQFVRTEGRCEQEGSQRF